MLRAGAQLLAHPGDNVERIEGADESDPSTSPPAKPSSTTRWACVVSMP